MARKIPVTDLPKLKVGAIVQWRVDRQPVGAFKQTAPDEWEHKSTRETYNVSELKLFLEQYGGTLHA